MSFARESLSLNNMAADVSIRITMSLGGVAARLYHELQWKHTIIFFHVIVHHNIMQSPYVINYTNTIS